jgi:hypothetical protein
MFVRFTGFGGIGHLSTQAIAGPAHSADPESDDEGGEVDVDAVRPMPGTFPLEPTGNPEDISSDEEDDDWEDDGYDEESSDDDYEEEVDFGPEDGEDVRRPVA